jgi:hypothetical protein
MIEVLHHPIQVHVSERLSHHVPFRTDLYGRSVKGIAAARLRWRARFRGKGALMATVVDLIMS